ncbi:NAD(P)-dependent dehydrogenase, short-chain alcohol dehydrogenase family [Paracoccus halophilus]|uniref:3-beta hydroxysteroid dehydrogenase n=1 Tax=Paracoccus halophilus TaxID=376733 RepID=A0A099F4J7_9RHOB|nr:SDR family oxidoreductase [Paracoccus halophilus]KGJ05655.1 3-beta hydroxysteroid dehydrogenase [Paracoccus halophilus]SFA47721.1 NAD(P)-dependent dehydrogenase, short-chain alcohol dehydrogenase family [Paracoccus halophilus]
MGRVQDKVAIVTGASLGLGESMARMLAREGAKVVLTDIKDEEGERVAKAIADAGGTAIYLHHDVTVERDWEQVMQATLDRFGRLDVLANNAGVGWGGPPEEETLERWRQLMSVNLDGVFLGTKHAILAMKRNDPPGGSIINLSSIEGLVGDPNLGAYNASKGGVRLYTKSTALYCAKAGLNIRVNSVHPGYIWTPMVENHLAQQGDVEEGRQALNALHPIGHVGEPDDIAYGVLYLASDESKFVTGTELVIDGGYTAQ